jgi:hypothetical protein
MATKAENFRSEQERSGPKKERRSRKPPRPGREIGLRILESSRTRGQNISVRRPHRPV